MKFGTSKVLMKLFQNFETLHGLPPELTNVNFVHTVHCDILARCKDYLFVWKLLHTVDVRWYAASCFLFGHIEISRTVLESAG